MPRGGTKPGQGHAPWLQNDNNIRVTADENSRFVRYALDNFLASPPDLHDAEQVHAAIVAYFDSCDRNGVRPGNLGLYAALGMSKQDVHDVIVGKNKSKATPAVIDLLKRARQAMSLYRESLANAGKINPVTYIFMSKNFDGLSDVTQIEVSAAQSQEARLSPEEIAKQIEKDIPIDGDYTEADNSDN